MYVYRHIHHSSSLHTEVCCHIYVTLYHVLLLWLVVGISSCVQRHFGLVLLITALENQNWTERFQTDTHLLLIIHLQVSGTGSCEDPAWGNGQAIWNMDLGYRGGGKGERGGVVLVHPSVLRGPMSHGTAGAETLRIRTGNVFTPGKFIEPAEQSTGGIFMCPSMCVFQQMCMYTSTYRHVLMNGCFNGSWKMKQVTKRLKSASPFDKLSKIYWSWKF